MNEEEYREAARQQYGEDVVVAWNAWVEPMDEGAWVDAQVWVSDGVEDES